MERHSQIEDEAAEWLARRDSGRWSDDDEARLKEWIRESTANRVAYLRLKSTWDTAARLRALRAGSSGAASQGVPAPEEWRHSPYFEPSPLTIPSAQSIKPPPVIPELDGGTEQNSPDALGTPGPGAVSRTPHRARGFAIAAGVLVAVVSGIGAYVSWESGDRYTTPVGGLASVPMSDGSTVTLNTDSEIRVAVNDKERRIELEQGEAFFDVAPDAKRPFIVRAAGKRITVVGTKFSVQHLGENVKVLVTEGRVRVEEGGSAPVLVGAGTIVRGSGAALKIENAAAPRVEEILSWREGYLRFHETALADAVAEMNRYNLRKIVIDDPKLAAIKISGTFRPTQYEAFVRILREGYAVQARTEGERISLTLAL